MEIILSKIADPNEQQERVIEEMGKFDLYDFLYDPENKSVIAVTIITENQIVVIGSFIENNFDVKYNLHYGIALEIYKAIYEDGEEMLKDDGISWQDKVMSHGNIIFELCAHSPSLIRIPEKITEKQMKNLTLFIEAIKECVKQNESYFRKKPITFDVVYKDRVEFITHNELDKIISNVELIEGGTNERIYGTRASQKSKVRRIGQKRN